MEPLCRISSSPFPSSSTSSRVRETPTVIVGGGPAGLASALLLASRGWNRVTLVERYKNPYAIDPSLQFSYGISWRGLTSIDALPKLAERLTKEGVRVQPLTMTLLAPGKKPSIQEFNIKERQPSYSILRSRFLQIMSEYLAEEFPGHVKVLTATECTSISFSSDASSSSVPIHVRVRGSDGREQNLEASLLLGCDGAKSLVRRALEEDGKSKSPVVTSAHGFGLDKRTSPSVGLQFKSLELPPHPVLMKDPVVRTEVNMMYVFRPKAIARPAKNVFPMWLLPVGTNVNLRRTGTIVQGPDHAIWKVQTAEEAYGLFEENFPHIPLRELIVPEEMDRFVATRPGAFPPIQRSQSLVGVIGKGNAGVVLLGDAAHCFPPDLALGVNAALEDVKMVVDALDSDDVTIGKSLERFSNKRDEDISALMRIMEIGFPYQYGQSKLGTILWGLNRLLRRLLNELAPSLFSPQITSLLSLERRYSQILQRANETTFRIHLLVASLVLAPFAAYLLSFFKPFFKL